jgi:hypothetical protein
MDSQFIQNCKLSIFGNAQSLITFFCDGPIKDTHHQNSCSKKSKSLGVEFCTLAQTS